MEIRHTRFSPDYARYVFLGVRKPVKCLSFKKHSNGYYVFVLCIYRDYKELNFWNGMTIYCLGTVAQLEIVNGWGCTFLCI